jgi:hypothetical protein
MADHSNQIGQKKLLQIIGIRMKDPEIDIRVSSWCVTNSVDCT